MRREASTRLEKPTSLGLSEGLLTPVHQHLFLKQVCVFNGGTPEESLLTQKHFNSYGMVCKLGSPERVNCILLAVPAHPDDKREGTGPELRSSHVAKEEVKK